MVYDPVSDFDSLVGMRPRRKASIAMSPDEEESLLASLGHSTMSGLQTAAHVLDTPGHVVRSLLAGRNPLPGITDPEQRTTGRDLLERWGVLAPNKPGFDAGDVAGFAADIALDPLTYAGGIGLVGKAGKVAKAAGLAKGLKRTEMLTSTLDDLIKRAGPEGAKAAEDAAKAAGVNLADAGGQKVGAALRLGFPFSGYSVGIGTGPRSLAAAQTLDTLGNAVRYGNIPGTQYSPGRHAASLFDATLGGAMTTIGQKMAARDSAGKDVSRPATKAIGSRILEAQKASGVDDDALRAMAEGAAPASGPLGDAIDAAHKEMAGLIFDKEAAGLKATPLEDQYVKYWPREASLGGKGGRSAMQHTGFEETQLARHEYLKNIEGGTQTIKTIAKDPEVEAALAGGVQPAMLTIAAKYGSKFADPNMIEHFAGALHTMDPELRAAGIFGNSPVADFERAVIHGRDALSSVHSIYDALAEPGVLKSIDPANAGHAGTRSLGDLFQKLDVHPGSIGDQAKGVAPTNGALFQLSHRLGVAPTKEGFEALKKMRISEQLYNDMTRYFEGFKSPESVDELMKLYDSVTNLTKAFLTGPWPAFQTRNFTGGQFQNMVMGAFDRSSVADAWRLLRGGAIKNAETIPVVKRIMADRGLQGPEAASEVVRELARNYDLVGKFEGQGLDVAGKASNAASKTFTDLAHEFPGGIGGEAPFSFRQAGKKFIGRAEGTSLNPLDVRGVMGRETSGFGPVAASQDLGYLVEGLNRLSPFINMLRKGVEPGVAAAKIGAAHVNYANRFYTPLERNVLQRLFPFYKFTSRQIPFLLRTLSDRPGGILGQSIKAADRARGEGAVPDQISSTAAIPIPEGFPLLGAGPGGDPRYLTGFGVMPEDPLQFFTSPKQAGLEALSRLNPMIKGPLEAVTGQSFFERGPNGGRPIGDLDPIVGRILANVTGQKNAVHYPGASVVEPLLANSPLSRALTTARTLTDPRKGFFATAANLGTGMRLTDVSPAKREALLREQAQEQLLGLPGAKTFADTYIPEERFQQLSPEDQKQAAMARAAMNILAKRAKARQEERQKLQGAGKL